MGVFSDSKKMNYIKFCILLLFLFSGNLFSLERNIKVIDIISDLADNMEDTFVEEYDSNNDGSVDYLVRTNLDGDKVLELMDFNHDGTMDDFYFYTEGIIVRREVDSNFDFSIDIWVYIKDGSLIEKYEQDMDFNGDIDKVKIFGGEEES
ncbi:MAG: hypothetical protein DRP58_00220 [Spirochaetes bacterium]|nr:MAG: hypothetical protein DRP58_00220 [Spirochaetota bacterium]